MGSAGDVTVGKPVLFFSGKTRERTKACKENLKNEGDSTTGDRKNHNMRPNKNSLP